MRLKGEPNPRLSRGFAEARGEAGFSRPLAFLPGRGILEQTLDGAHGDALKMKELSDRMGVEWEREDPAAPVVEKGDGGATDAKGKREQGAKVPSDNG
jgi:hypothetical protein